MLGKELDAIDIKGQASSLNDHLKHSHPGKQVDDQFGLYPHTNKHFFQPGIFIYSSVRTDQRSGH